MALKVTEPSPPAVAESVLRPTALPTAQLPTVAIPAALVTWSAPVAEPPPATTAKVTATPSTGLPKASVTKTEGATETAVWITGFCPSPVLSTIRVGGPASAVAETVVGTITPGTDASIACGPAMVPSVHTVLTCPAADVDAEPGSRLPAPTATVIVTGAPGTGVPKTSTTSKTMVSGQRRRDDRGLSVAAGRDELRRGARDGLGGERPGPGTLDSRLQRVRPNHDA